MVKVIDAGLSVIELRRWDPFDATVGAYSGNPTGLFDEAVVRAAGQDFFVDIGSPALSPTSLGVVGLAAVAGHGTAWERATAVAGVQNDPLTS